MVDGDATCTLIVSYLVVLDSTVTCKGLALLSVRAKIGMGALRRTKRVSPSATPTCLQLSG
jgi:hypothetical protein